MVYTKISILSKSLQKCVSIAIPKEIKIFRELFDLRQHKHIVERKGALTIESKNPVVPLESIEFVSSCRSSSRGTLP